MGAAVGKQFQNKSTDLRTKRSSIIVSALQSYQKEFPNERIGVENGHYDPILFRRAVLLGIKEHRIDGSFRDMSEEDMDEVGKQYFDNIPKSVNDAHPQTTNVVELLVEDLGDNDVYESRNVRAEEKGGKYNGKNHDEKSFDLRSQHSAANLSIGEEEDGDTGSSPATRHTPTVRSRSFFSDNSSSFSSSSSVLPILSSSSAIDGDYAAAVNHRVSLKSSFQTGDDKEESFLSGLKFMSADDKRVKSKSRDSFKSSQDGDHLPIHIHEFDRPHCSPLPEDKWEGFQKDNPKNVISSPSGISPTSAANYRIVKNLANDDKNFQLNYGNSIGDMKNDSGKHSPKKSKNITIATAPMQDGSDGIRREFRRKVHTTNKVGSDNEMVGSRNGSGDDNKHMRPAVDSVSSKNLKKSTGTSTRKKSLEPMNLTSVVNGRINIQRAESQDSHNTIPGHTEFSSDEVLSRANCDPYKSVLPAGFRSMKHGEGVMGLQMQRIMSSAQNAQLQKEVDALQKQLAQLEQLEGEMEISSRQTSLAAASINHVTALGPMPYKKPDQSRLSSATQSTDSSTGGAGNLSGRSAVGRIYPSVSPGTYRKVSPVDDHGIGGSEATQGGKYHNQHQNRNSGDIINSNVGPSSNNSNSNSRVKEEKRDRDWDINNRNKEKIMTSGENRDRHRERSKEGRETTFERDKPMVREREREMEGTSQSSFHRGSEREREWRREELREEGKEKERERREKQREKEEADDLESPRYGVKTPPRRSGSLTGSASKIASITKSAITRRRLISNERGGAGGNEEVEYIPKLSELDREMEREREREKEKDKDKNQPNRAKRISVATSSFSNPTSASSSSSSSSGVNAYLPFQSAPAEDVRFHVRSPRGSKRSTGVSGGGNSGVGDRRNVPSSSNSSIYGRGGTNAVAGASAGVGSGKKDHDPKGQNTPYGGTLKLQSMGETPPSTMTKSPRSRGQRANPHHFSSNVIHSNNNSNNNSDTNSTPGATERNHFYHDAVGVKMLDSNECSDDDFETISDKRRAAVKETEARREREGGIQTGSEKLASRNEGEGHEVVQSKNKVNAMKLYEKRISREERSKIQRSQIATVGVDESDGESRMKEQKDADMDYTDQNSVHSNHQYSNTSFSIAGNAAHGTTHSSISSPQMYNSNGSSLIGGVGGGCHSQVNNTSHSNFNMHIAGGQSRLVSRRNCMDVDNEYSASEHSDNGGDDEKDRGSYSRSRKTQSQSQSQGKSKLTARRRLPYGHERSGNSENEREREKDKEEEVNGKEYQSSAFSGEKRKNQIHGSSCNNMVGTRGNNSNGNGTSKGIPPSDGLGEESYTDHDFPVTASHPYPYSNPAVHEVSDAEAATTPNSGLSSKVKLRKSKRRMSFPRQPTGNSLAAKEQSANQHIDNSGMSTRRTAVGPSGVSNAASSKQGVVGVWTDDLDSRWGEVDFLLRKRIESEEDIGYTTAAAEAGMLFIDQLNSLAKSLGILRGTLSRWLLPYDNNTRIDEQCSTPHSVVDNMPEIVRGKISERQVHYLVAGANGVRRLVRIKIADDNDLEQARVALLTTINFFKKLQVEATKQNLTNFQLFGYRT